MRLYQLQAFVTLAADELYEEGPKRAARIAQAKWAAGRFGRVVAHDVLQMHGAIGLQDETPISHYARRLMACGTVLGDSEVQVDRFIEHAQPEPRLFVDSD